MRNCQTNNSGFTYITALTVIVIMGIMLAMVGQSWKIMAQRELEEELLFRGEQVARVVYQRLVCKNANFSPQQVNQFLWNVKTANGTILDDLVKTGMQENCFQGGQHTFKLRPSAALDPFTGEQWDIVTPATALPAAAPTVPAASASSVVLTPATATVANADTTHFSGVRSISTLQPLKRKFAPDEQPLLNEAKQYADWMFTWEMIQKMESTSSQQQPVKK